MRALATILVLSATLVGCAPPKPVNLVLGEACERCKRPVSNERLAGEHIGANGFALKFRTIHCMSTWIAQHPASESGHFFVANYETGSWIRAHRASFVRIVVNPNTMERDFVAFADSQHAAEAARANDSAVVGWEDVLELGRSQPLGGD